jgi:hypothetical protein
MLKLANIFPHFPLLFSSDEYLYRNPCSDASPKFLTEENQSETNFASLPVTIKIVFLLSIVRYSKIFNILGLGFCPLPKYSVLGDDAEGRVPCNFKNILYFVI